MLQTDMILHSFAMDYTNACTCLFKCFSGGVGVLCYHY